MRHDRDRDRLDVFRQDHLAALHQRRRLRRVQQRKAGAG